MNRKFPERSSRSLLPIRSSGRVGRGSDTKSARAFWFFIVLLASGLGLILLMTHDEPARNLLIALLGGLLAIVILRFPAIGLGMVVASAPIVELFPQVPLISSVLIPLGGFTVFAFLMRKKRPSVRDWKLSPIEILSLLFIFWVFISNPSASFFGRDRSWILTFAQLWILLWLGRHFVPTQENHHQVMTVAAALILVSAIFAVQDPNLGVVDLAERAAGLSGGANTAARYFIYGMILLGYLQNRYRQNPLRRAVAIGGIVLLIPALFATESRSGLVLLGLAFLFLTQRFLAGQQRSVVLWLTLAAGLGWILVRVSGTDLDPAHIADAVLSGSDTVGARYDFWNAGWAMWLDHPIFGVGIGRFRSYLVQYWRSPRLIIAWTPHNTYIQVLSETGIVGLLIFTALLIAVIRNYISKLRTSSRELSNIHWTWMTILIVLLVGSMTKTDLLDKFFWFLMGMSANTHEEAPE